MSVSSLFQHPDSMFSWASSLILWTGLLVIVLILAVISLVTYLRIKKLHSKRLAIEEAQLNKKEGASDKARNAAETNGDKKNIIERLKEKVSYGTRAFWGGMLIVGAVILVYWSLQSPRLRLSDIGGWSWKHWFPLFIAWVVGYVLIAFFNVESLKTSVGTLRWALTAVVLMLFFGIPAGVWVAEGLGIVTFPRALCPAFSPDETHSCIITEDWSLPITTDRPTRAGEFEFCVATPETKTYEVKKVGINTYQVRSPHEAFPIRYRLMPGNKKCPKSL